MVSNWTTLNRAEEHNGMNVPSIRQFAASLSLVLAVTSAQAVHISPNGTGQVLLFPYYTVRNGFSTLVSVTNTQNNTKAVKVRFLEGMNGHNYKNANVLSRYGGVVEHAYSVRLE